MQKTVDISTRSFVNALVIAAAAWLLWAVRDVAMVVLFAVILSAALHPSISWLERRGFPRPFGVLSLYVLIMSILSIIVVTFTPIVVVQFRQLVVVIAREIVQLGGGNQQIANAMSSGVSTIIKFVSANALATLTTASGLVLLLMIIGLLIYYLTVDHGSFRRFLAGLAPVRFRQALLEEGNALEHRLSLWLRGQLTLGLVIAVCCGTGLFFMHVPYALVLGLIAGLCELIPMVGPYLGMLPAAAIGFSVSPWLGGGVIILYYIIQQVENNFLTPKIVSHAVGLSPLVVLLALLIGAKMFGVIGLLLAVPSVILIQSGYAFWKKVRQVQRQAVSHV